jgi:hypothetical protein
MPICPNCEATVEYKGGMLCDACGFDFNSYKFVPWSLLNLKFHPEKRTHLRLAAVGGWMLLPPIIAMTLGTLLSYRSFAVSVAFSVVVVAPISIVCFLLPLSAAWRRLDDASSEDQRGDN